MSDNSPSEERLPQPECDSNGRRLAEMGRLLSELRGELPANTRDDLINRLMEMVFPYLFAQSHRAVFRNYSPLHFAKHTTSIVQIAALELWGKLRDGRLREWSVREFLGLANLELTRTAIDIAEREKGHAELLQRKLKQDGLPPEATGASEVDDYLAGLEDSLALHRAVAALPKNLQEPIQMHYFNELSVRQVAELLNESPTTMHRRIAEAKDILGGILPNPLTP